MSAVKTAGLREQIAFLQGLAAAMEKNGFDTVPDVHLFHGSIHVKWAVWGPDAWDLRTQGLVTEEQQAPVKRAAIEAEFAAVVDLFPGAVWEKNDPTAGKYDESYYELKGKWEDVSIAVVTYRKDVCERVVVLEHDVIEEIPDPELVAQIPLIKQTVHKEVVEWQCNSAIAAKTAPVVVKKEVAA